MTCFPITHFLSTWLHPIKTFLCSLLYKVNFSKSYLTDHIIFYSHNHEFWAWYIEINLVAHSNNDATLRQNFEMRKQNLRLASAASNVAPIDRKAYRQLSWFKSMYSSRTDKMKVNFVQCLCVFKNFDEIFFTKFCGIHLFMLIIVLLEVSSNIKWVVNILFRN